MIQSTNLDLLRSLAVSFVVISHLRYFWGWQFEGAYSLATLGRLGVAIFFVHTTLVLMMSLERTGEAALPFLIRRVFRIYPLSCTIVTLSALPGLLEFVPLNAGQFVSNLLLVQNLTGHESAPLPLWTLPYEVQMYLFLPYLFALTRSKRPRLFIGLLCASASTMGFLGHIVGLNFKLLQYVPCFLPGALAFVLWRAAPRFGPVLLFSLVGLAIFFIPPLVAAGWPEMPLFWLLCLMLGLIIPQCREIENKPFAAIGQTIATYSYGVYLTHTSAIVLAFAWGGRGLMEWAICALMLPAFAFVAYHGIEKPGIALGRRIADRTQDRRTSAGATTR
jgi:peptidoglycan/LPS O-acetylase OafA/YrhL